MSREIEDTQTKTEYIMLKSFIQNILHTQDNLWNDDQKNGQDQLIPTHKTYRQRMTE